MGNAYPIQTLSDGRVKYSDGSIRGTSKTNPYQPQQTVSQKLFQQGAKTSTTKNIFGQPQTVLPNGQTFQTPSNDVMNSPSSNYNPPSESRKSFADILTENAHLFSTPSQKTIINPIITNSPTGMDSAKLKTDFTIENNPQFLNFKELWNNIQNAHNSGSWKNAGGDKWYNKDYGLTEFLKPKIAYAAEKNSETGADSGQAGVLMSPDVNKFKLNASNLAVGSDVYPIRTLSDGRVQYSDGSIKSNGNNSFADLISKNNTSPEYKLGNAEKTATEILKDKVAKDKSNGDSSGDIFTIIDPNLEEEIKKNAEIIYNNGASEAEVAAYIQKAAEDALNVEYDRLNTEADLLIPKYQRYADESIDEVKTNQKEIEDLGATKINEANNSYAEKLLQSQLSKRADDTKLRNLFSSLGTAESSAFIENMTKNTSDYGKYETELGTANIKTVGDIDKEIVKAKTAATKQIDSITKDKEEKIAAVEANKSLYAKEKYVEKQKIMAEYKVNMQSIYQDISDKTTALQNLKLEFMMGQSNINQNAKVSSDLLEKEYQLQQTTSNNINSKIPPELDTELTGFSLNPQSSIANNKKKDQLKLMYPQFADMIEQVYSGGANYNTIKSQLGVA